MRESFIFYTSFGALIELLPSKKRLPIYEAIYHYGAYQKEADFGNDPQQDAVWRSILPQLKANQKRYENGKKGAESGILGGAPKGNSNAKKTTPKTTPNLNDNVNPYQDLQKGKRNKGESTRAREATPLENFLDRWKISFNAIGNYSGGRLAGIDWDRLSERVQRSSFLQQQKAIGFYIAHYADILDGKYDDIVRPQKKPDPDFDGSRFANIHYD